MPQNGRRQEKAPNDEGRKISKKDTVPKKDTREEEERKQRVATLQEARDSASAAMKGVERAVVTALQEMAPKKRVLPRYSDEGRAFAHLEQHVLGILHACEHTKRVLKSR